MAASIQQAAQGSQLVKITVRTRTGSELPLSLELIPGQGYRMPPALLISYWDFYSHMAHKFYPTIEAFLDDAAEGWKSWQHRQENRVLTNAEETAIVKVTLHAAGICPASIRHYRGPMIITMGRPAVHEDEFLQIEEMAWQALDSVRDARNCCSGIHVVSAWSGKLKAGYERFRRIKR